MEKRIKLPKSVRRFVSTQKAQIRRQFSDAKKQAELIQEMYNKLNPVKVIPAK
jgi:hypothetical protein